MNSDNPLTGLRGWGLVTKESHPWLFEAFEKISHDAGAGAGHTNYSVPPEWIPYLKMADDCLKTLAPHELETFCIGEEGEKNQIKEKYGLIKTDELLEAFFDDWNES